MGIRILRRSLERVFYRHLTTVPIGAMRGSTGTGIRLDRHTYLTHPPMNVGNASCDLFDQVEKMTTSFRVHIAFCRELLPV